MSVKVKICGIRTEDALDAAVANGADFVGLVFFPRSPRNVAVAEARRLRDRAHAQGDAKVVALTVDPDDTLLDEIIEIVAPDYIQLHGHETDERVRAIRKQTGLPLIKAIGVLSADDVARAESYLEPGSAADIVLFDAKPAPGAPVPGGNGLAFDWRILEGVAQRMPLMLSGGLTAENVGDAVRVTGATTVDVSSGVETSPGVKSPELIRRFLQAAKTVKQTQ
jgi:phosphoribosylanthranilate isomerase